MADQHPTHVGTYTIRHYLGMGECGKVYRASHQWTGIDAVVKLLPEGFFADRAYKERFEQEVRILALYDLPPAIVPVDEYQLEGDQPYLVTHYFPGGSLAEKLESGPLEDADVFWIASQLAFGLDFMHRSGVKHRNIKPENILFDHELQPHLVDYDLFPPPDNDLTGVFHPVPASLSYLSPEQALNRNAGDERSDVYSLAGIVYAMLSGHAPFVKFGSNLEQAVAHIRQEPPDICLERTELPTKCSAVIQKGLAKSPGHRYATPLEFVNALGQSLGYDVSEFALGGENATGTISDPPKIRNRWMSIAVFTLLVLVVGIIGGGYVMGFLRPVPGVNNGNSPGLTVVATEPAISDQAGQTNPLLTPSWTALASLTPIMKVVSTKDVTLTPDILVQPAVSNSTVEAEVGVPSIPIIGGADKIAMINESEIWLANLDGSGLEVITQDKIAKTDLEWLPDGSGLIYHAEGCFYYLPYNGSTLDGSKNMKLACLGDLAISPDMKEMIYGNSVRLRNENMGWLNYTEPYSLQKLTSIGSLDRQVNGCFIEGGWQTMYSSDGKRLASIYLAPYQGRPVEVIRLYTIDKCGQPVDVVVAFPDVFFTMRNYIGPDDDGKLDEFGWNGEELFAVHGNTSNGFGDIVIFNTGTRQAKFVAPIEGQCCYQDIQWSPDGQYLLFVFKDARYTENSRIYYIPYGTIDTGRSYQPLDIPVYFFAKIKERVEPALRPAVP